LAGFEVTLIGRFWVTPEDLRQVPRLLEDGVSWRTPAVWQAVARHGKLQFLICCGRLVPMVGS